MTGRLIGLLVLSSCLKLIDAQPSFYIQWSGTWATAAMRGDSRGGFVDQTLRQIVHASVAGSRVRIRIANLYGTQPLQIEDVHIALRNSESSIVAGSDCRFRFGGRSSVIIQPGAATISDPIKFNLHALADVAISFYLPHAAEGDMTFHPSAHETNYVAEGDVSGNVDLPKARTATSYYLLTNLDVEGSHLLGTVVTLGASITEGFKATSGGERQWPSVLARRLAEGGLKIGVLNEGISGNRLLRVGAGDSAESRFERDVLDQPGVRWVIFSDDPINDLGSTKPPPGADELIAATKRLISEAHQKRIKFLCSTLTPFQGANYWTKEEEVSREQFNSFVRSKNSGCDGVIDQDLATHDPSAAEQFLSTFDSGDHLHPNDAGHQAIAESVDLSLFRKD